MHIDVLSAKRCNEMKTFLRLRGLKMTGLIARAFMAAENNLLIIHFAEEVIETLVSQYNMKLDVYTSEELGTELKLDDFKLTDGYVVNVNIVVLRPFQIKPLSSPFIHRSTVGR